MIHRCRFHPTEGLPAAARDAFARDGVIVIEDFVPAAQCDALKQRALALVTEHAPQAPGTVFSTRDQRHARDAYFEASANRIGVFFEEGAFDEAGRLCVPLERAVNKLGQSMYIFKQPGIGGEVNCHQDSTYLYTEPESVLGFWFAIEDAHRGNGCLGGLPGEHGKGLKEVFRRQGDGQLKLETPLPSPSWDMARLEWLEVRRGALVVFNGSFPHLSEANRSAQSRHAYTLHAVSGQAHYPSSNWIQRRANVDPPFAGFV